MSPMRAVEYAGFGEPEVLRYVERPVPEPGAGEVLIRVAAAGLNPIDYKTRKGLGFAAEKIRARLPWIPGYDVSGTIEKPGAGVVDWQPGAAVIGMIGLPDRGGCYAEYVIARADEITAAPESIPLADAAAVPLAALTAWQALFDAGSLSAGDKILIHAAAGGVGHFAAQFAKNVGAYVIGTASAINHDFLHEIGVDEAIDYRAADFTEQCYGLDFVLDTIGGDIGKRSLQVLSAQGQLVTVPTVTAGDIIAAAEEQGVKAAGLVVKPDTGQLQEIVDYIDSGDIRVAIGSRFPLAEAIAAHRQLENGHGRGKIILETGNS